jgi:fumarylacetoacetase
MRWRRLREHLSNVFNVENSNLRDDLQAKKEILFPVQDVEMMMPGQKEVRVCSTNYKNIYWNMVQQLAHQTVNGCNINVGDIYSSGTISGSDPGSSGSMIELTRNGTRPVRFPDGSERRFLEDHDTVILRGYAEKNGKRIGFGEASVTILPAKD